MSDSISRRNFLRAVGVAGVAGTVGCGGQEVRQLILPLVVPSEEVIPGVATWYATTCLECSAGCGLTVRTREGRATKVEGNPEHPVNRGGLCVRGQASLQGLYNPDRIRGPLQRSADGSLRSLNWDEAKNQLAERIRALLDAGEGHKIAFLSGRGSDSLSRLTRQWMRALHSERHHVYEPFSHAGIPAANRITFGRSEIPSYDIQKADYLLSFGADFLETWLSPVAFARDFAQMHAYRRAAAKLLNLDESAVTAKLILLAHGQVVSL